jgi:hypothetical protein
VWQNYYCLARLKKQSLAGSTERGIFEHTIFSDLEKNFNQVKRNADESGIAACRAK